MQQNRTREREHSMYHARKQQSSYSYPVTLNTRSCIVWLLPYPWFCSVPFPVPFPVTSIPPSHHHDLIPSLYPTLYTKIKPSPPRKEENVLTRRPVLHQLQRSLFALRQARHRKSRPRVTRRSAPRLWPEPDLGGDCRVGEEYRW